MCVYVYVCVCVGVCVFFKLYSLLLTTNLEFNKFTSFNIPISHLSNENLLRIARFEKIKTRVKCYRNTE